MADPQSAYISIVADLEQKWLPWLEVEGRHAIHRLQPSERKDFYFVRDTAVDAIEKLMFDNEEWELVKATEISDIACEIGNQVTENFWTEEIRS